MDVKVVTLPGAPALSIAGRRALSDAAAKAGPRLGSHNRGLSGVSYGRDPSFVASGSRRGKPKLCSKMPSAPFACVA